MNILSIFLISFIQLLSSNEEIELLFAGDAMQHLPQITNARTNDGNYDYSKCFELIKDNITNADFAAVNLECPLGGKPYSGYPCFSAPDSYASTLKNVGFDMFLIANNHSLDRGDRGARRTISTLDSLKIPHIGVYDNIKSKANQSPYITVIKGVKFAFIGYTYGTNGIPVKSDLIVNYIDRNSISADIKKAKQNGAEMICVMLHWGIEYQLLPNKEQKSLADFLIDEGVDLIIGGHPHVIQPYEIRKSHKTGKDILIVYSLGNFISNQNDTNSRGGAMVKVFIDKNNGNPHVERANYSLVFVQKPSPKANYFQLIPALQPNFILPHSKIQFDAFTKKAREIFDKHNINVPEEN
ncbi:MAG: CapA family protein [Muribaculaceae bacterium]|nr:CapA family protein [Muribaculaceae bacterium]